MNNKYIGKIIQEIKSTTENIEIESQTKVIESILKANRVFVAGVGRSGMMARCFAMRLMHIGLSVYMVGEVVTPAISSNDLLIIASGSGTTASLVQMAKKAKEIGAKLALVTIYSDSDIGKISDLIVQIDAPTSKSDIDKGFKSIQPMGSLFEQSLLVCLDCIILLLMEKINLSSAKMYLRHANLE